MNYLKQYFGYILMTLLLFALLLFRPGSSGVSELFSRDSAADFYREIIVLREKNIELKKEVEELESSLAQLSDQNKALAVIQGEIEKYLKLSGERSIYGPGVSISMSGELSTEWFVDLINEFFRYGGQAVAVNGVRLTNKSMGFNTLPRGQILLNGVILKAPYNFDVIGEAGTMLEVLEGPGGMFDKIEASYPGIKIEVIKKEVIQL